MKNLSEEEQQEIIKYLKEKTGAPAFILMTSESTIPCEEEKETGKCTEGHRMGVLTHGIHEDYKAGIFEMALEKEMNRGSIKSPFKL